MQQGDILIQQTNDGGEIEVVNGIVTVTGGFESAAYLSLFGGEVSDTGIRDDSAQWWGNYLEPDPAFKIRSEFQRATYTLPLTPSNLLKFEEAAQTDLAWFVETGAATAVTAEASIPAVNRLTLAVTIEASGGKIDLKFNANWEAMQR